VNLMSTRLLAGFLLLLFRFHEIPAQSTSPIRFTFQPIPFRLENSETPNRHAPETMAGGVAVFDFDNDGDLDIYFANGAGIPSLKKDDKHFWNRLYANDGKGAFSDVTEKAGVAGSGYDMGIAVADFDNDGFADLFVGGVHKNTLFHNNGNGTFTDVTASSGIQARDPEAGPLWSVGGVWADVNRDGLLDLFVVNYLAWDPASERPCQDTGVREYCHPKFYKKTPNDLYLNAGGGKFRRVSEQYGLRARPGKGMGVAAGDLNSDGWPDFFVPNDKLSNTMFMNKDGKSLEELAFENGTALLDSGRSISGMGVDARDLDNDGLLDLMLVALDDETFPVYRNTGKGVFTDVTIPTGMAAASLSMAGFSVNLADFDNDGWRDVFVARGHVQSLNATPRIAVEQHNSVLRNVGGKSFTALTGEAGFMSQSAARHRGAAVGDFDGDGRLDIVVTALAKPAEIWRNASAGTAAWIALKLTGTTSNRDGIGTAVKVSAGKITSYDQYFTTAGYASSSAGPMHFGLGPNVQAVDIELRWPSGIVQRLTGVRPRQVLKIAEPAKN
jgi:enediyne biosynthesis protein E4